MAAGFETLGWVLSVEDKATDKVKKITGTVEEAVHKQAADVGAWQQEVSGLGTAAVEPLGDSVTTVGESLVKLFQDISNNDAFTGIGETVVQLFQDVLDQLKTMTKKAADDVEATAKKPIGRTRKLIGDVVGAVSGATKTVKGNVQSMTDTVTKSIDFVKNAGAGDWLTLTILTPLEKMSDLLLGGIAVGLKSTFFLGRQAVATVGNLFQKFLNIETVVKGVDKMGGIAGVLLGPIAPLLKLFSPLIDMVVRQFTPAIETFSAIIETAFGPFAMTLEIIARNLATQLVPLIAPFAAMMEIVAVQIGVILQGLLKGKPDKIFAALFTSFKNITPVLMSLLNLLLDVGQDALGAIIEAAITIGPLVIATFGKFLKAIAPLIPVLTKLAITLLQKVFIPMLEAAIKLLDKHIIPFIEDWMPAIVILIEDITDDVADFFGNFGKYAKDFKILFIDPITKWINETFDMFKPMAGKIKKNLIDPILAFMAPVVDKITKLVADFKYLTGEEVGAADPAQDMAAEATRLRVAREQQSGETARRANLGNLTGKARQDALDAYLMQHGKFGRPPGMAAGGVVKSPVERLVGEAGPELVLPLRADTVKEVLAPLIPDINFPEMSKLLDVAMGIERRLSRTLRVDTGEQMQAPQRAPSDPFSGAVGMDGVGGW